MSNQEPTRVNIQFSIELDELPSEVDRLIKKSNQHIATAEQFYTQLSSNENNLTSDGWEGIDNIRRTLAKSDQVLDDLQKIISGYLRMKSENFSPPQQEAPTEDTSDNEQQLDSPFLAQHPDARNNNQEAPFGGQKMDMQEMKSQMMQVMAHMQQKMDSDNMTEEEQEAADILKNRISRVMGADNEKSSETGK